MNGVDCLYAIEKLFNLEVVHYRSHNFEFTASPGRQSTKLPRMRTPRRYTHDSCTLVVALLGEVPSSHLPEPPKRSLKFSDISTFEDLYRAAGRIQTHCVAWVHQAGYLDLGTFGSLGVFLMATNSYEDRFIPPGVKPSAGPLTMPSPRNHSGSLDTAGTA
ncbi:MAG: hypothetical protein L6R40_004000 [Gallowayella cf. fulva]|nr:MAG: hypothetical protein L6R40_004000 [Xanthomendoza cf. fulva]